MKKHQIVLIAVALGSVPLTAMAQITDATTVSGVSLSGIGDGCYGDGDLITLGCTKVNGYARENHNPSASVNQELVNGLNTTGSTDTAVGNTGASTTITGSSTTINGTTSTQIKGGTHSGILTLQDGNTTGGGVPDGTSVTIAGSADGSKTSTVLQTTTAADGSNVQTKIGTSATDRTSTATLQAGGNGLSVNSGDYTGSAAAAVTVNGTVTNGTSKTGVLITGSGQNGTSYTNADRVAGTIPTWADVAIQSKSYGQGDPTLGSVILVTDYGVQILSPQPTGSQKITNNTGVNNSTGTIVNNNGSNTGSGSVINNNGMNSGSGGVVNNTGGTSGSGSSINNIGMNTSSTGGTATNNIGGGSGATTNNFGNTNPNTTINSTAGSSTISMSDGVISMVGSTTAGLATNGTTGTTSAAGSGGFDVYGTARTIAPNTTINNQLAGKLYQNKVNGNLFVDGNVYINGTLDYVASDSATISVIGGGVSTSILSGADQAVSGSTGIVLKGTDTPHIVVDDNGKLLTTTGVANQSSTAMVLTNGYGNTHGIIINESQTTVSGGTNSSSLTLNDAGARFSNSANGKPIIVTGVADGRSDFDAVNFRQLRNIAASTAAMANLPVVDANKTFSIGLGIGHHEGETAYALGIGYRPSNNSMFRASVASGIHGYSKPTVGMGASLSW